MVIVEVDACECDHISVWVLFRSLVSGVYVSRLHFGVMTYQLFNMELRNRHW